MSGATVRISNDTAEAISRLSKGTPNNREFIEGVVSQLESGDLIPATSKDARGEEYTTNGTQPNQNFAKIDADLKSLIVMVKMIGQHVFGEDEGLKNALELLTNEYGKCIQCNEDMSCSKCGCHVEDHLIIQEELAG